MIGLVLDTDVFSELTELRPRADHFARLIGRVETALAFPTVAELYHGAVKARWGEARIARLENELDRYGVLWPTEELLRLCGTMRAEAARLGHPLGQPEHANDLWIAACAIHYGVPLLTGNTRHFQGLPGLELAVPGSVDRWRGGPVGWM